MIYNKMSRRMFLQGTGNLFFTIPLLESLMPVAAFAQSTQATVRYIQMINQYGYNPDSFYKDLKGNSTIANNIVANGNPVRVSNLIDFPTPLSRIIGSELSSLRNKFSILRGLDVQKPTDAALVAHNLIFPTCASPNKFKVDYNSPPLTDQQSIDSILAASSLVYPAGYSATRRQVVFGPGTGDPESANHTYSWRKDADGVIRMVPAMKQTDGLFSLFQSGFTTNPTTTPQTNKQADLMNAVFEDYKRVRDGTKISSSDKVKLEAYMSLISDIQRGFASTTNPTTTSSCKVPTISGETSVDLQFQNQARILAAALACNLTRVASIAMVFDSPDSHGTSHNQQFDPANSQYANTMAYYQNIERFGNRLAFLMKELQQIPDGATNLLDNSIIYWTTEFGLHSWWGQHVTEDYPVIVAGGGGGKLQQGKYIDFRLPNGNDQHWNADANGPSSPLRGIPINNLLVTFMNCMGLSSQHYETVAGRGYGYYSPSAESPLRCPDSNFWYSTQGRRSPLPYFYNGSLLG